MQLKGESAGIRILTAVNLGLESLRLFAPD